VMGHGVRSALVTAMLRAMVGDLEMHANDPGRFLSEMNRKLAAILKQIKEPLYATAFYLVADVAAGQMRYAKAGHPAPLHLRRQAGVVEPLPSPSHAGAALGLFEKPTSSPASVRWRRATGFCCSRTACLKCRMPTTKITGRNGCWPPRGSAWTCRCRS